MWPERFLYKSSPAQSDDLSGLKLAYRYGVLAESGNKRYAKKEIRSGIRLVAVEITNETDQPVTFGESVEIFSGDQKIPVVEQEVVNKHLKQKGGWYLFWSLFVVVINKCDGDDCSSTPLPVGLGIGLVNLSIASGANKNFANDLRRYYLLNKEIQPGETVSGLIGIRAGVEQPLQIKLKK
jgi:hypothetical protein